MRHFIWVGDEITPTKENESFWLPRSQQPDGYEVRVTVDEGDVLTVTAFQNGQVEATITFGDMDHEFTFDPLEFTHADGQCFCEDRQDDIFIWDQE